MYQEDTFFHLSFAGRTGLVFLSIGLAGITLWVFAKISSRFGLFVKVLAAFVSLWIVDWLSPQIYYLYYSFLFDDLPMQLVIGAPPGAGHILQLAATDSFS